MVGEHGKMKDGSMTQKWKNSHVRMKERQRNESFTDGRRGVGSSLWLGGGLKVEAND